MVQAHRVKTVAIVGCTSVGKSDIAVKLAREIGGEIISADSMQIYRGFDIGTGKLSRKDMCGVAHHMIDIADGDADFSVGDYVESAKKIIYDISVRGKLPLIVGGTGLYVNALFSGCNFADSPKDVDMRNVLKLASHFFGGNIMHKLLRNIDEQSACNISENDTKRIIRALEIYLSSGKTKTDAVKTEKPYDDLTVVLTLPRDILYERINNRVHKMFDDGLIDEVNGLMRFKNCGSMQALGYKQIAENPGSSRIMLEELTAQKTRNYAKRQITYFKNIKLNKVFIDARDYELIKSTVTRFTES